MHLDPRVLVIHGLLASAFGVASCGPADDAATDTPAEERSGAAGQNAAPPPANVESIELQSEVEGTLEGEGEQGACYGFAVEAGVTYTLELVIAEGPTLGAVDPALRFSIEDDAGKTLLAEQRITAMQARLATFEPMRDGRALLCIDSFGSEHFFRYVLRVDPDWRHGLQQDPDTFEPNDTSATSFAIEQQSELESAIEDELDDDSDCYRFEAEADVTYTLGVAIDEGPTLGAVDPELSIEITGQDAATLLSRKTLSGGKAGYFTFESRSAQTATVCLDTQTARALFRYRIRIDPDTAHGLEQNPETFEPNNSPPTAFPIEPNQELSSALEEDIAEHVDCYRFQVEKGRELVLDLAVTEGPTLGAVDPAVVVTVEGASGSTLLSERSLSADMTRSFPLLSMTSEEATLCLTASRPGIAFHYVLTLRT